MPMHEYVQVWVGENVAYVTTLETGLSLVALCATVNHSEEVDLFPASHTQNRKM